MVVRPLLGGFVPSAGVGTGYRRDALEKLAEASANRLFEPEALTEDYENGLKMFRLGCSQAFVPPLRSARRLIPGDARIFSAVLERGAAAADPLGDGHRAARLAAQRVGTQRRRAVLDVAGP